MAQGPVFGSTSYKANFPPAGQFTVATATPAVGPGLSTALDARLESGLETKAEIRLRKMLSIQTDTLQGAFTAPLPMPPANGHSTLRAPPHHMDDEMAESVSTPPQVGPCSCFAVYSKNSKNSDTQKIAVIILKLEHSFYYR